MVFNIKFVLNKKKQRQGKQQPARDSVLKKGKSPCLMLRRVP